MKITGKILVTGDRHWNDERTMEEVIKTLPEGTLVVHGACSGADWFADEVAKKLGYATDPIPADWDKLKRAAGPVRNREMVKKHPDISWVYAFHNDIASSKGTKDMVSVAEKAHIPVELVTSRWPVIDNFNGDFQFLSNFQTCDFTWKGQRWTSLEHAYQCAKVTNVDDLKLIRNAKTPGLAKRAARVVRLRDDWEEVKVEIMAELLALKFAAEPLRSMLLATGDATLIEGNTWGDTIWGVCKGKGTNYLGKLLMKLRDELSANVVESEVG